MSVLLSGPATAWEPLTDYPWWRNWCAFFAGNHSTPDQYAWHMETGGGNMLTTDAELVELLHIYGLMRVININESMNTRRTGSRSLRLCVVDFPIGTNRRPWAV